jgi:hypothetical protein
MTVLSAVQVADYWIGAGGPRSRAVEWVAIAIGESDLDDQAVSPVGAIGLWQIMPFNAAPNGVTVSDLYLPAVNARVAVLMSGYGANCAAWDSAYRDIEASGRYSFLSWPEQGSADWDNLATAQAELSGHGLSGLTDPGGPGVPGGFPAAVSALQVIGGSYTPAVSRLTVPIVQAAGHIGRRGWRP